MPVRLQHLVLTLSGVAQQLTTVDGIKIRVVSVQPRGTNANAVFLGATSSVSSTDYGVRLPAASGSVPPAPFILGEFEDGSMALDDIWVLGTNGEHLHVLYARYQ